MYKNFTFKLFIAIICLFFQNTYGIENDTTKQINRIEKRIYTTQRIIANPPVIDGKLDDKCWEEGTWSGNYKQFSPTEGAKPLQKTEIKILYDDENIYVAIRAYDNEPEKIDRQRGRRDNFIGDIIGVCFDSYFDHRTGFEFDLTAAGSKIDLVLLNDSWDTNWDAVWYGKVGSEDSAWTAEMQIPLSQLRYGNKNSHIWGLHAWRWINRNQEEDQWNLMPRDNPGFLYTIGELHGIEGIEKNRRIEFLPYTVGKFKTYEKEKGNPYADGFDPGFSVGIDGKIGITSNFTLDYSVNPDFGQVEADPSNLNLTVFETYYDEKRPFFLEGRNIFNYSFTDNQLFYSRRIGHAPSYNPEDDLDSNEYSTQPENTTIISAIKLSGKTKNGLSLGIIESLTSQEFTKISKNDIERKELAEPLSNYFIGRVQKDINQSNTIIGGMITAVNRNITEEQLNSLNKSAYTGGFDLRHHWKDKTYYIDAKTVFSHISGHQDALLNLQNASSRYYQRPDAKHLQLDSSISSLSGHGGNIEIGKGSNGKLRFSENINWRSPGLEMNDLGFQQSADNINNGTSIQFVQDDPVWKLRSFSINFYQENNWDFSGKYINSGYYLNLNTFTENKWFIYANLNRVSKQFDTKLLRGGSGFYQGGFWCQSYGIETDASKKVSFRINYHFHFHDDRLSRIDDLNPGMTIKISNILILSPGVSLSKHKIGFQYLDTLGINENKKYILAQLERKILSLVFRADLAITPEITIQYYYNPYFSTGKYSNFKLVVNPGQKNIENQYRLIQLNTDYIFDGSNYQFTENIIGEGKNNIEYPDFFYFESHSNFVFRWEYKPGSTLYFVWTRSGSSDVKLSETSPTSQNIFLFKLNYWFSL